MPYDATFHRGKRLRALARWSEVGVLEPRARLPIEARFAARVDQRSGVFFRPVLLCDSDSVEFHRQLSYLIDAFDALPERVDIAFDSTWKAFEVASAAAVSANITDRLKLLSRSIDVAVTDRLCASIPVQSCEYLFKKIVADIDEPESRSRFRKRIDGLGDSAINQLVGHLRATYGEGSLESGRKGALLLRRALRGEILRLGSDIDFQLSGLSRSRFLMSVFLYTARNDRIHGESFSPFVSSVASLRTYTHPYFAFLASYYLLLCVWRETMPDVLPGGHVGIASSLDENIKLAMELFGRHWER